mgnify:CR=1 FL=1
MKTACLCITKVTMLTQTFCTFLIPHISQAVDRRGDIRLYIVKISQLRFGLPEVRRQDSKPQEQQEQQQQQQQQRQHGLFLRLEPVPPSRHITHKPETFYKTKRFIRPKLPEKSFGRDSPASPDPAAPSVGSTSSSPAPPPLRCCVLPSISTLPHTLGPRGEETIVFSDDRLGEVFDSNLSPSQQAVLEIHRTAKCEDDGLPQLPRRSSRMVTKSGGKRGRTAKTEVEEGEEEGDEDLEVASLTSSRFSSMPTGSNGEGGGGGSFQGAGGAGMEGGGATAYPPHPSPGSNTPGAWPSWLRDEEIRGGEVPVVTYDMAWAMFEDEAEAEAKRGEEGRAVQSEGRGGEDEG